ncbi:3'-5' exoribonuclease 1 [Physocladia obscura]|uniref:3'-5' exoribonuclease 1 n=1 Tax=Physocladia obscura TaxID=109957 RepID=A0AAD5XCZ7_9FUNG|nr:3'-5' exoribonuclease 1 [Physocladia obscura]
MDNLDEFLPSADLLLDDGHAFTAQLSTAAPLQTLVNTIPLSGSEFVAPFVPCSPDVASAALRIAKLSTSDVLCDLGCGDGRILELALQNTDGSAVPLRVVGVELDLHLARHLREKVAPQFKVQRFLVIEANMFEVDLDALGVTVLIVYLLPDALKALKPLLQKWFSGDPNIRRIVTIGYSVPEWTPLYSVQSAGFGQSMFLYNMSATERNAEYPESESEQNQLAPVEKLRVALAELGLSSKGQLKTLKKRMRGHRKNSSTSQLQETSEHKQQQQQLNEVEEVQEQISNKSSVRQPFDYYLVFDVEATCEENNRNWTHEIIEFPVVVIGSKTMSVVAEFRSFVKPVLNPTLSPFCTQLTGITQEQVDTAPQFPAVLKSFEAFLSRNDIRPARMAFCTDGPWDIRDFVRTQCEVSGLRRPSYLVDYIDVRRMFARFYLGKRGKRQNLAGMLTTLGMTFEGREHSGIDDARNIARIVLRMMADGCVFDSSK